MYQCHPVGSSKRKRERELIGSSLDVGFSILLLLAVVVLLGLREVIEADCRNSLLDWRPIRFDERFLIECFFFLPSLLCFCWQVKENKSVGKSCLFLLFLAFLLSLFDCRSYISPVERKRERQETQRYNTADVRAIYRRAIRQGGPWSSLFFLAYSLVLESSLSCRFGR